MTTIPSRILLCALMALPLAACGGDEKPRSFAAPDYSNLRKVELNVANIDIDEHDPPVDARDMSLLAPNKPADVLREMARTRLVPNASSGHAVFTVEQASVVLQRDKLLGNMAVRLEVSTSDGLRTGFAEARVTQTHDYENDGPNATRAALDDLINQMMTKMNVEFIYQVRRSLRSYLMTTPTDAPAPSQPIQSEDLTAPKT